MELNRRDLLKPPGASFVTTAALSFLPAVTSMATPDTDSDGVSLPAFYLQKHGATQKGLARNHPPRKSFFVFSLDYNL